MVTQPADARVVTEIYKPFFLAGILTVLTAGCLIGALALIGIAAKGNYTATSLTPFVLAHANSQLYGWVGFFVIGFTLQQHAPRESRRVLFYSLARWSLGLMAIGIALRFAAEPLATVNPDFWVPVGVFSAVLQAVALITFIVTVATTRFKGGQGLTWQSTLVFSSLVWWLIVSLAEPVVFALSHGPNGTAFVAQWFSPYRDAQFLGFVTMMAFGVALTKLSTCFGAPEPNRNLGIVGFFVWNVGLIVRMVGWSVYFRSGFTSSSIWHQGGALLAIGACALVASTRMFSPMIRKNRSQKFVRAAFGWLLISGVLLCVEPWHLAATNQPFSHAFTGAIRHAITVGFISQMIIAVSIQVVASMNDLDSDEEPKLWSVFWLLNSGNLLRVGLEIATDYSSRAFYPLGATGMIELSGVAIWAVYVSSIMVGRRTLSHVR